MIFDTHAHYDDEAFDEDREQLLASLSSCKTTLELARNHDFMYAALGVHPSESAELSDEGLKDIETWCTERQDGKVRAIGEIGLDYYWEEPDHETQKKWFHRQLNLARELKLPVIIHSRDAAKDTLDIMKEEHSGEIGGVIHCFSYGKEMAAEYLKMGFYLGIGGVLTFKNAKKLLEVAEMAPLDRLVLETDCPYLAPVPNRGKRNSSLNLPYVAEKLAEINEVLAEVIDGDIESNQDGEYYLKSNKYAKPLKVVNMSTGMKSFALIKRLLESGNLKEKDVIILDEPEIHLHPEWQLLYAKMIVLLQKQFDLSMIITTHSPYFLDAIDVFSAKYNIADRTKYYLAENTGNTSVLQDVTNNIDAIYKKLSDPMQMLENLRYNG